MHSSQSNRIGNLTRELGGCNLITGMRLFLDGKGNSGAVLHSLAEIGVVPALSTIRKELFGVY